MLVERFIRPYIKLPSGGGIHIYPRWIALLVHDPDEILKIVINKSDISFLDIDARNAVLQGFYDVISEVNKNQDAIYRISSAIVKGIEPASMSVLEKEMWIWGNNLLLVVDENGLIRISYGELINLTYFELLLFKEIQKNAIQKIRSEMDKIRSKMPRVRR